MKIKPLSDRVVLKPLEKEQKTAGGIIIPDTAKEKSQEAEVVAVGPGKLLENGTRQPIDLKVGDKVLYSKYSGNELKMDGVEYIVIEEKNILAVLG